MYGYGPPTPAGPPPGPAAAERRGPGARALIVRWLFATFPVWSLGLLSWVPMLRFALQRKRGLDWAVFALYVLLTAGLLLWLDLLPAEGTGDGGTGGAGGGDGEEVAEVSALLGFFWLSLIVAATIHAVRGDRFERPRPAAALPPTRYAPAPYPAPTGYAPPPGYPPPSPAASPGPYPAPAAPPPGASPRMRQVADELDELGAYLRKEEEGGSR